MPIQQLINLLATSKDPSVLNFLCSVLQNQEGSAELFEEEEEDEGTHYSCLLKDSWKKQYIIRIKRKDG